MVEVGGGDLLSEVVKVAEKSTQVKIETTGEYFQLSKITKVVET